MLEIKNLDKFYSTRYGRAYYGWKQALKKVNLQIPRGENCWSVW